MKYITKQKNLGNDIIVITYNYDIFLERLLKVKGIAFNVEGFENKNSKVKLIKPHGSISFVSKVKLLKKSYEIKRTFDSIVTEVSDLKLEYDLKSDNSLVNVLIPPAGDSNRHNKGWVLTIREILNRLLDGATEKDELILFGVSYWHVDRMELDEIITTINSNLNVKYIDPKPSSSFNAVLSSIFKNYIHLKNSECLLEDVL